MDNQPWSRKLHCGGLLQSCKSTQLGHQCKPCLSSVLEAVWSSSKHPAFPCESNFRIAISNHGQRICPTPTIPLARTALPNASPIRPFALAAWKASGRRFRSRLGFHPTTLWPFPTSLHYGFGRKLEIDFVARSPSCGSLGDWHFAREAATNTESQALWGSLPQIAPFFHLMRDEVSGSDRSTQH